MAARFFDIVEKERVVLREVYCNKKAFFCGDCCDKNQAIILLVLVNL